MSMRIGLVALALGATLGCHSSPSSTVPSSPSPTPTPSGAVAPVSIVSGASTMTTTAYAPNPIVVSVGGSVTWTNKDTQTHTATANDNAWNSGPIAPGAQFSRTFSSAGTFQYFCTIHPGMVGTVTVQ